MSDEQIIKLLRLCTILLIFVAGVVVMAARLSPTRADAQTAPVLINGGFEEPYREVLAGELKIANGWLPWWTEANGRHRPEWAPYTDVDGQWVVQQGTYAQKAFTTFSTQDGGLFQKVSGVTPGAWYRFSCDAYVWSSSADDPLESTGPHGTLAALVGINPWGDTNALARTTVWGRENDLSQKPWKVYDRWIRLEVIAQAWGSDIAVFTRHEARYGAKHNDSLWDNCTLELYEQASPQPTYTPYPTYTPGPPCPTAAPSDGAPGSVCDYGAIRSIIETVVAGREPVRWPRIGDNPR